MDSFGPQFFVLGLEGLLVAVQGLGEAVAYGDDSTADEHVVCVTFLLNLST